MRFLLLTFKNIPLKLFNASPLLPALAQVTNINNLVHDHLMGDFYGHIRV